MVRCLTFIKVFTFLLLLIPAKSWADCIIGSTEQRIERTPIIFKGVVEYSPLNFIRYFAMHDRSTMKLAARYLPPASLKVLRVYKGDVSDSVNVFGEHRLIGGHQFIVFANEKMALSPCNPSIDLNQEQHARGFNDHKAALVVRVEEYKARKDAKDKEEEFALLLEGINELAEDLKGTLYGLEFNQYKAGLIEDRSPEEALKIYAESLSLSYEEQKKTFSGDEPLMAKQAGRCVEFAQMSADIPKFLRPVKDYYMNRGSDVMKGYGRTLFKMGEYQKALLPLCIAEYGGGMQDEFHMEALAWKVLTLLKLGRINEIGNGPFEFRDFKLTELNLTGATLSNANFAGAHIDNLIIRDANLSGAIFDNARIEKFEVVNSKLVNTSFKKASITGSIEGSDLSSSSLECANFNLDIVKDSSFVNADASHAAINVKQVINTTLPASASNASFCRQ